MGNSGKLKEKEMAQTLRRDGYSYKEIRQNIKVSKSTLSLWCRDIKLTRGQYDRLYRKKRDGRLEGCFVNAKRQQMKRIEKTRELMEISMKEVGKINKRDIFVAGVMLYAAEGAKRDGEVAFSNADCSMIRFMSDWFRKICYVSEEKFRGKLYIHDNLDEGKAKGYWSRISGIPINQFHKSYIAKTNGEYRKNVHNYGIFSIRISDRELSRKIKGWIKGVLQSSL